MSFYGKIPSGGRMMLYDDLSASGGAILSQGQSLQWRGTCILSLSQVDTTRIWDFGNMTLL